MAQVPPHPRTQAPRWGRRSVLGMLGAAPLAAAGSLLGPHTATAAGSSRDLDARVRAITGRPEFAGAHWGMEFRYADTGEAAYSVEPGTLFTAASSMKVFVAGTAFAALGADRRFHTTVHRTGRVVKGVLHGDLVLVAGGDLLIGGRLRRDGTIALPEPDHSYGTMPGARPAPGDPLAVVDDLAAQVARQGLRRVEGRVLIDTSLFREAQEDMANGGLKATISPIMVNDNIVDVTVVPGARPGDLARLRVSPRTGHVTVRNDVTTTDGTGQPRRLAFTADTAAPDGSRTVTLTGDVTAGGPDQFIAYFVAEPTRFAATLFAESLRRHGVHARPSAETPGGDDGRHLLAEHVSPPLHDQVKVMLKVSSNLHTVTFPYVVGATAGGDPAAPKARYSALRRELFAEAGLDPDTAESPGDLYTPATFTTFLRHVSRRRDFRRFREALPIMGVDGSLKDVQPGSPAAGHVYGKTGTAALMPPPGDPAPVALNKALAGFVRLPSGRWVTFGLFMNQRLPGGDPMAHGGVVAQAMGEIATAAYLTL
ncbi:D-alanyl-D-alanine carboxypeptidase/D-alanyl-D-alanine endopeptidase [Phytomonospora endophytica]|uniref:D-alanyl-D-alanine carboxypeptidase/D-alanyl-D-alanine-endopeptidase (Penicillin-binding protein 4) n=1 Tax=Phytomonospora endophytica TaxID=714109 RepID=A0A841FTU5_9ACTN|nr:D-alanyl-D-alanine carboxypeptidase/D-alanyl-D-alanine-endopeptidase [Phytomonospora endophytica]MBB6036757.1 D-alanyl-D-alanine carboxypeptidase/D-alanyl-D-alanine-endopeptidase (penicillin-binding protein 4) [Phytomonospora endophytica]GIG68209.1 D-alanyl-D-alanine carboxypeptidase/D-alanyl-D-alanine-endopeptidase [Phytomonospora endophytica]